MESSVRRGRENEGTENQRKEKMQVVGRLILCKPAFCEIMSAGLVVSAQELVPAA